VETVTLIARVLLLPFAVALTTVWGCRLALGGRLARYETVTAFAVSYLAAFVFVDRHEWLPDRHWHWLPYATLVACFAGAAATHVNGRITAALAILTSGMAAWWLVPNWMKPPSLHIPAFAIYLWSFVALHAFVLQRVNGVKAPIFLVTTSLGVAAMTAGFVSASYGQLAAIPAATLAGVTLAKDGRTNDSLAAILPAWVMSTAGVAYIGCIEPQEPLWGLLLAPAAPLWISASFIGPLSGLSGMRQALAQMACLLAGLAVALLVTLTT